MNPTAIKFLDAYKKSDIDTFFGRNIEIAELFEKVKKSPIILLYGLSGTGKTSLVQCGLANKFNDSWLPLFIRRGDNLLKSLRNEINLKADTLIHPDKTLIEALNSLYLDYFVQVTIIFDQFEELFISGDYEEIQQLIDFINELIKSKINCNLIIILREEYLAYLDVFELKIPIIFNNRMRLEKMRKPILKDVIKKIANNSDILFGDNINKEENEEEKIIDKMLENISDIKGSIDLPYLQVYLDTLYNKAETTDNFKCFNLKLVDNLGKLEDILGVFLEEQVNIIINDLDNRKLVWAILKVLITSDGTKKAIHLNELKTILTSTDIIALIPDISIRKSIGLTEPVKPSKDQYWKFILVYLKAFEKSRILKLEYNVYELSHDSLASKIAEHRTIEELRLFESQKIIRNACFAYYQTGTLLDRRQLTHIASYLSQLSLSADEKKIINLSNARAFQKRISFIAVILLIVGLFMYFGIKSVSDSKKIKTALTTIKKEQYNRLLNEAENSINDKDFTTAFVKYSEASKYTEDSVSLKRIIINAEILKDQYTIYQKSMVKMDSLSNLEEYDKALLICDSILKVNPGDNSLQNKRDEISAHVNEAVHNLIGSAKDLLVAHEPLKACVVLERAHNLSPGNKEVMELLKNCKN